MLTVLLSRRCCQQSQSPIPYTECIRRQCSSSVEGCSKKRMSAISISPLSIKCVCPFHTAPLTLFIKLTCDVQSTFHTKLKFPLREGGFQTINWIKQDARIKLQISTKGGRELMASFFGSKRSI